MLQKIEVEVSKESYETVQGLVAVLKSVKEAMADGWQVGEDLPKVLMVAVAQLAAVEGIDKIDDEIKEDPAAFGKAMALGLADIYGIYKKEEPAPVDPAPVDPVA